MKDDNLFLIEVDFIESKMLCSLVLEPNQVPTTGEIVLLGYKDDRLSNADRQVLITVDEVDPDGRSIKASPILYNKYLRAVRTRMTEGGDEDEG